MIDQSSGGRREALVKAAYDRIAEAGFEGLRTRDVAAEVGINVATLHYHFPTKEALIRGVVQHTMRKFAATLPREGTPAEQLRGHLAALRVLLRDEPPLWAVLAELALRATRDPAIAAIVGTSDDAWHRKMRELLAQGVEGGCLDRRLDPDRAAALIVSAVRGASMPSQGVLRGRRLEETFDQLEHWLGLTKETQT